MKTDTYHLYSAQTYVREPADLWEKEGDPKFRHRVPRVVNFNNTPHWVVEDGIPLSVAEDIEKTIVYVTSPAPDIYVQELNRNGIAGAVLYPSVAHLAYKCLDTELLTAVIKTYNNWVIEFCRMFPKQLKAIALLNVDDPNEAVAELERTASMGAAGVMIPLYPHTEQRYDNPKYEILWRTAERLGIPISFLTDTLRQPKTSEPVFDLTLNKLSSEGDVLYSLIHQSCQYVYVRIAIASLLLSGVFARYPNLRVVVAGFSANWVPYFLTRTDEMYEVRPERTGIGADAEHSGNYERFEMAQERIGFNFTKGERPSDYFRRNVYVTFQGDPVGRQLPDFLDMKNLLWEDSQFSDRSAVPVSHSSRDFRIDKGDRSVLLASQNAARLYGF